MNFSKAHFIGIAGKGMSATALLLKEMGVEISGSDEGFYPPVSDYLKSANIAFSQGYRKENIPNDVDVIIIGKNAKLQPETNEEVRAAFASGKLVRSFADVLHEITTSSETIVVAGSYGKSTCTALLAWCLRSAEKDPSYFIGEVTNGFEKYAHRGRGPVFVLEGDEYPSSNWDNTSKFLRYNAKNVLLTSATHDHINIFPTHADYLVPFRALLNSLPPMAFWSRTAANPTPVRSRMKQVRQQFSIHWKTERIGMLIKLRAIRWSLLTLCGAARRSFACRPNFLAITTSRILLVLARCCSKSSCSRRRSFAPVSIRSSA